MVLKEIPYKVWLYIYKVQEQAEQIDGGKS